MFFVILFLCLLFVLIILYLMCILFFGSVKLNILERLDAS